MMSFHGINHKIKAAPFVMIEKQTLRSKEWKELSHTTKLIYILVKANYNGSNNGEIPFSYRKDADVFAPATISKGLKELVSKDWLDKTQHGGLYRHYCLYKLTGKYDYIRPMGSSRRKRR
jgi:hypothetical protein